MDHPLFCDALGMTLQAVAGIEEIAQADRLSVALERIEGQGLRPDVIVLDLNLPDVNGLEGLMSLRAAAPDLPIVVVSSVDEPRVIRAAILAGAAQAFKARALSRGLCRDRTRRDLRP